MAVNELLAQMSPLAMSLIIADNDRGRHQHEKQLGPPGRSHRHRPPVFASPEASDISRRLLILPGHRRKPNPSRFAVSEIQTAA